MTDLPPPSENPYQAPLAYASRDAFQVGALDAETYEHLRRVAIYQRGLFIAAAIYFMQFPFQLFLNALRPPAEIQNAVAIVALISFIGGVVALGLLGARLNSVGAGLILALLMFFPCANIVIFLYVNHQANALFRRHGLGGGIFGVRMSDLKSTHSQDEQ